MPCTSYIYQHILHKLYFCRQNIEVASEMFHGQPQKPMDTAVYWVEHVLKYGGDHLKSHAFDMPWYQYLMLDVIVVLLVTIQIVL